MIRQLPIKQGQLAFSFKTDLDNRPFTFTFTFNERLQRWTFDIFDDAGEILVYDIPVFVQQLFLKKYKHDDRLPQGNLFAINLVSENEPPDKETLGADVLMLYEDA